MSNKKIKINCLFGEKSIFKISPLSIKREWMEKTNAYRCLPLNIANQYGWAVHSPVDFTATWSGNVGNKEVSIYPENINYITSHFGHGILTVQVDFVIQTDPNISIYVKGITNNIKSNIHPLEGIVETDWLPFTFTMNYKFDKPGSVSFKKGEPLFMFFPIDRTMIEEFEVVSDFIGNDVELFTNYNRYGELRSMHNNINPEKYQKFYKDTKLENKKINVENHKNNLNLKDINVLKEAR
jgi:hypothetical protein